MAIEAIKKPRQPWETGVDPLLVTEPLLGMFYPPYLRDSSVAERRVNAACALHKACSSLPIRYMPEDIAQSAAALSLRNEFGGERGALAHRVPLVLGNIYDARWSAKKLSCEAVPAEQLVDGLSYLFTVGKEHNNLYRTAPAVEVAVGNGLSLIVGYDATNWEGIGAVNMFLRNEQTDEQPVPAFSVRGNPVRTADGALAFDIRTVQSWVSDKHASVTGLRSLIAKRQALEPSPKLQALTEILDRRDEYVRQFSNAVFKKKSNTARYGFVAAIAIAYLHSLGVEEFRGITHGLHPECLASKRASSKLNIPPLPFNYDQFWNSLGLRQEQHPDTTQSELHSWKMGLSSADSVSDAQFPSLNLRNSGKNILESVQLTP